VTRADVLRAAKRYLAPRISPSWPRHPSSSDSRSPSSGGPSLPSTSPSRAEEQAVQPDAPSLAKGREILARVQRAVGGAGKLAAVKDFTVTQNDRFDPSAGRLDASETDRWIAPSHCGRTAGRPAGDKHVLRRQARLVLLPAGRRAIKGRDLAGDAQRSVPRLFQPAASRAAGANVVAVDDRTVEISAGDGIVRLVIDPAPGCRSNCSTIRRSPTVRRSDGRRVFRFSRGEWNPGAFSRDLSSGWQYLAESTVSQFQINTGLQLEDLERRHEDDFK